MHILTRRTLLEFAARHPDAYTPLDDWYRTAKRVWWSDIVDVRQTYPHADAVGGFTVFNIGGTKYRLITEINYKGGRIYIIAVLTHAEYNKGAWKR